MYCYQQAKMEQHLALRQADLKIHSHDILQHLFLHATNKKHNLVFLKYQGKQLPRYYLLETKI